MSRWMIYGANGYTGELIAREAARRGLKPILAGRSRRVEALARELALEARVFELAGAAAQLGGVGAVLHCAGPFSATSRPMLDACLAAKAHYLDITGELEVFEAVFARDAELKWAGIAALPGAGFDVVPTDCLAAMLKRALPEATTLKLAFRSEGRPSRGTLKSMLEGIAQGGRVRRAGRIVEVPLAARSLKIDFKGGGRPSHAILAPWGDVSTAYHSTGIADVEFYIAAPPRSARLMRVAGRLMRVRALRKSLGAFIERTVLGPGEQERTSGRSWIWGEVADAKGRVERLAMELPEGYRFTVLSAIECAERVAAGKVGPGAWTPSMAFGPDFVLGIEGVSPPRKA